MCKMHRFLFSFNILGGIKIICIKIISCVLVSNNNNKNNNNGRRKKKDLAEPDKVIFKIIKANKM